MPMTIRFVVKGSAICYQRLNLWHVVFICDETHLLNFSYVSVPPLSSPMTLPPVLRRPGVDRNILVTMDNQANRKLLFGKLEAPIPDPTFGIILNMAGADLHGPDRLKIVRTFNPGRELIVMTIPGGILSPGRPTTKNYYVQQIVPPGDPKPLGRPVAAEIHIDATLEDGDGLSMLVLDGAGTSAQSFPYSEGGSLTLTFDNDCGSACKSSNDFGLYYDWLEDKDPVTYQIRRFTAGKDSIVRGEQGNCDPVIVEPPPSGGN